MVELIRDSPTDPAARRAEERFLRLLGEPGRQLLEERHHTFRRKPVEVTEFEDIDEVLREPVS